MFKVPLLKKAHKYTNCLGKMQKYLLFKMRYIVISCVNYDSFKSSKYSTIFRPEVLTFSDHYL